MKSVLLFCELIVENVLYAYTSFSIIVVHKTRLNFVIIEFSFIICCLSSNLVLNVKLETGPFAACSL